MTSAVLMRRRKLLHAPFPMVFWAGVDAPFGANDIFHDPSWRKNPRRGRSAARGRPTPRRWA